MSPMQPPRWEFVVGARIDPVFGPVVVLGEGGTDVELDANVRVLMPPLGSEQVVQAIRSLRGAQRWFGYRGQPPMDIDALGRFASGLGELACRCTEWLDALEVNPLWVGYQGEGVSALDALITARPADRSGTSGC